MARPGDGGIRTRKVALLVADGVQGAPVLAMVAALTASRAVPTVIAPRLGPVATSDGKAVEAFGTLENSAPVLFDAVVLPDGKNGVAELARYPETIDFVGLHYRHGKTILALGDSGTLLEQSGAAETLPSGAADPGVVLAGVGELKDAATRFILALGKHRHPERERARPTGS
jgi:catalase